MSKTAKIILKHSVCVFLNIPLITVILNYSTIWLLTPTLSKKYSITRLYYVSISVSIYLLQTCPPPYQNQIFKIPITMTCSRDEETHVQLRNGRIDSNQILHINSLAGPSNIFDMTSKLVEGFQRGVGAKTGLSH